MNKCLIEALRAGRIDKKLKQNEVAEILGVKGGTLSNYENGISEPDIDTFAKLCDIYELDFASLLEEAYGLSIQGSDFRIRKTEIESLKKYRSLDVHGKEMVDMVLEKEYERSSLPITTAECKEISDAVSESMRAQKVD